MAFRFDRALIPPFPDLTLEQSLFDSGIGLIAGLDEAGRGAWAGPVTAAAVVFDPHQPVDHLLREVKDSKQLHPHQRQRLEPVIKNTALAWGIGFASNEVIDQIGILPATRLAMTRALDALGVAPLHLLIDALFLPEIDTPQTALIKGDQRSLSIAAASILAKTSRDRFMVELGESETGYAFSRNKGYGTRSHQAALNQLGACSAHRFSFSPLKTIITK